MMISVLDIFKIGIGPSSSHTVGPMLAARRFIEETAAQLRPNTVLAQVKVTLFGSLASTGIGHGSDKAVMLGLMGFEPHLIDPAIIEPSIEQIRQTKTISLATLGDIAFDPAQHLIFEPSLAGLGHPNAMHCLALDQDGMTIKADTFFSIGGGFIQKQGEELRPGRDEPTHVFTSAKKLLELCQQLQINIDELVLINELCWHSQTELDQGLHAIWQAMQECVNQGLKARGLLPGGLSLPRRAAKVRDRILLEQKQDSLEFFATIDWVNAWALAVNEENAAGGRVVTAPTNGAAGIVPAVLMFAKKSMPGFDQLMVQRFLLTASAFGYLFKRNASISGAEVGCQGEVGSACAMAAAGLACLMGGSPEQIENAAEIATEHNLGLTCDPVAGLVQVPCIERNAIAAVKAINAARMALLGDGEHFISFDKVVKTVRETGADMQSKYKETSEGGLAVNSIEC